MIKLIDDFIQVLSWGENITLKNSNEFREKMDELIHSDADCFILNLANTDYINSAGLGIIANHVMEARTNKKELILAEIDEALKEIFSIVKFDAFIKVFDSEADAIAYFKEGKEM